MIKYIEYDSMDETGQHIIPVNTLYHMNKTASGTYSPEIMKVILNMKRNPDLYYVVINALGSHEVWGPNRNGDSFPVSGLQHKSLRTDMGTPNDYGYKTFEYYARLYKHHVNKDPKKSFGEIVFSHWNPGIQRVELIVGINRGNGADIVQALESGDNVAVSMGCKVKFDRCSICDNKAKTKEQYCKHLKNHLREIVSKELAQQWSRELGKTILPGAQVFAYNDFPRFFDMSKVYVGADRTSYILGKAASALVISSVDIAEAYGVTDEQIDKLAAFDKIGVVNKKSEIDKEIGGALGPDDNDGVVATSNKVQIIQKALDEKVNDSIAAEPRLPNSILDSAAVLPLSTIFSTMLGMGIYPKPAEVQRIVVIKIGRPDLADKLDRNNEIFDYRDNSCPCQMDISNRNFSDTLGRSLLPFLESRSFFPSFSEPRIKAILVKSAEYNSVVGPDYWARESQAVDESKISPITKTIAALAALYAGLKMKALGYGPKQLAEIFTTKPWLRSMIGGGVMWKIQNSINEADANDPILRPASDYEGVLKDTGFSGHIKSSSYGGVGEGTITSAIMLPNTYIRRAVNQRSFCKIGRDLFPEAGMSKQASIGNNMFFSRNEAIILETEISKLIANLQ